MKKKLLAALVIGLTATGAKAVPAHPQPCVVQQPDGTSLTVRLIGDEFTNYNVTTDGRIIMRTANGAYVYAETAADGTLRPGPVQAHDPATRQAAEKAYLDLLPPCPAPRQTAEQHILSAGQMKMLAPGQRGLYDYNNFKGLVILVNFNNKKFSYTNAHEIFTDMVNKTDFDGFMNNKPVPTKEVYTGSVRDYFRDNSLGLFDPNFDVVGPVEIDTAVTSPMQTSNMGAILRAVIQAADSQVDFSQYDTDHNGEVDMFYMIFAGFGSNYSGNNSYYIWPHASSASYYGIRADGVKLGRYACSTELGGWENSRSYIDGIGTVCHEFSHVLGLMDEYDTDYDGGGGQSTDPNEWSITAGAGYLNDSRTPVGYSLYERTQSGFSLPTVISGPGVYAVHDIDTCGTGYRINTPEPKEFFLLENRRKTGSKWNCYGPGEGMLVFRADSTNVSVRSSNKVNANPAHNYYELLRAKPQTGYYGTKDSPGDPFPGSGKVNKLTPDGTPRFVTRARLSPDYSLDSIWEDGGNIYFRINEDNSSTKIEDFEDMTTTGKYNENVPGKFTHWTFSNAWIANLPGSQDSDNRKALATVKGSTATTATIPEGWLTSCKFTVRNVSDKTAYVRLQAEVGGVMNAMKDTQGATNIAVESGTTKIITFPLQDLVNSKLQVSVATGSTDSPIYIDDFTIVKNYPEAVEGVQADAANPLQLTAGPEGITVATLPGTQVSLYDFQGRMLMHATTDASGTAVLRPQQRGCYIVAAAGRAAKILF